MPNKKYDKPAQCNNCGTKFSPGDFNLVKDKTYDSDGDESGYMAYLVCRSCGQKHLREEWTF